MNVPPPCDAYSKVRVVTTRIVVVLRQCQPCQTFTQHFAATYERVIGRGQPFRVVFISQDRSGAEFWEYLRCGRCYKSSNCFCVSHPFAHQLFVTIVMSVRSMPPTWMAVPYSANVVRSEVASLFNVDSIPTLVLIGPDGRVITRDGRTRVMADPSGERFPWLVPPSSDNGDAAPVPAISRKEVQLIRYGCRSLSLRAIKENKQRRLGPAQLKGIKEMAEFLEREVGASCWSSSRTFVVY